jgi:hypothetical protein
MRLRSWELFELICLNGFAVAILALEPLLFREHDLPSMRESVIALYTRYGWGILTVANVFAGALALLISPVLLARPLTAREWSVQVALALGIEIFGIPRLVDGFKLAVDIDRQEMNNNGGS